MAHGQRGCHGALRPIRAGVYIGLRMIRGGKWGLPEMVITGTIQRLVAGLTERERALCDESDYWQSQPRGLRMEWGALGLLEIKNKENKTPRPIGALLPCPALAGIVILRRSPSSQSGRCLYRRLQPLSVCGAFSPHLLFLSLLLSSSSSLLLHLSSLVAGYGTLSTAAMG